jgi:hypothetical protein
MKLTDIFCYYEGDGFFWFRIFGRGLVFKDLNKHEFTFSEREGYTKFIRIKNWMIKYLPYYKF